MHNTPTQLITGASVALTWDDSIDGIGDWETYIQLSSDKKIIQTKKDCILEFSAMIRSRGTGNVGIARVSTPITFWEFHPVNSAGNVSLIYPTMRKKFLAGEQMYVAGTADSTSATIGVGSDAPAVNWLSIRIYPLP